MEDKVFGFIKIQNKTPTDTDIHRSFGRLIAKLKQFKAENMRIATPNINITLSNIDGKA